MKQIILCGLLAVTFFSCEKKTANEFPKPVFNELEYKLNLPDTVIVNKPYKATVEFKSDFDKIIDPIQAGGAALEDPTKDRLITFYHYKPVKAPMKSTDELVLIDSTFVLNKSFEVDNIVFKEKGEYIFCGMILDEMRYQGYNEQGILNDVRFEELKQQIFKKVVVVE